MFVRDVLVGVSAGRTVFVLALSFLDYGTSVLATAEQGV